MNKTIFITGSTDGIGKLAAIKLAKEGHEIYIHGRNSEKLKAVISEIKELSDNKNIKGFTADFSELDSVRHMAQRIKAEVPKIDVLINNAGVYKSDSPQNEEGMDMRFAVNYFAPYLLTRELVPLLKAGKSPRILNLSSAAQAPVSIEALTGKARLSEQESYAQSKLALTMWSFDLAKKVPEVAVIAVNPGSLLNTNMVKEAFGHHWSSADKGANILYDLAVGQEYNGVTAKYFDNDKGSFGMAHEDAYDKTKIETFILKTESILN